MPENYEAIAHTYSLVLLFSRAKVMVVFTYIMNNNIFLVLKNAYEVNIFASGDSLKTFFLLELLLEIYRNLGHFSLNY